MGRGRGPVGKARVVSLPLVAAVWCELLKKF